MNMVTWLEDIFREKTCIVGTGNYLKMDDAAGLYVVDAIKDRMPAHVTVLNVEDVIESHVFYIAAMDCKNVLIIDAVEAGTVPGTFIYGRLSEITAGTGIFSTHKLSLSLSGKFLEYYDKEVYLAGIAADTVDFGTVITDEVQKSADTLKDILITSVNCNQKEYVYEY